jgi:hypothetical protein
MRINQRLMDLASDGTAVEFTDHPERCLAWAKALNTGSLLNFTVSVLEGLVDLVGRNYDMDPVLHWVELFYCGLHAPGSPVKTECYLMLAR